MSRRPQDPAPTVFTDGGVSAFTGEAFVVVRPEGSEGWQWSPREARDWALLLIRTADAAEEDRDIVTEMRSIKMPDQVIGAFLTEIRRRRARRL